MANLKGSTYTKQLRDMNFKLFALGEKKGSDKLSHSSAMLEKRNMYMRDFINYLKDRDIEGKLNLQLTENNLNSFLEERLNGLALSTQENYLSGLNSLIGAFNDKNITNAVPQNYFKDKWTDIKANNTENIAVEKRGLQSDNVLEQLFQIRYSSGVIATLMLQNGYRISEAIEIVNNPDKYISQKSNGDNIISGVVGKGGKIYMPKKINEKNLEQLRGIKILPYHSSFTKDLKKIDCNLRSHDFRYEFAKRLFESKVSEVGRDKALEIVSKALNHNRSSITLYYINH